MNTNRPSPEGFRRLGFALLALLPPSLLAYDLYDQVTTRAPGALHSSAQPDLVHLITAALVVLGVWLVSLLLLLRRYGQPVVHLLFLHGQALAANMVYCLAHPPPWGSIPGFLVLSRVSFYFFGPLTLHLSLTFPVHIGTPRVRRRALSAVYLLSMAALAAWLLEIPVATQIGELYLVLLFGGAVAALVYTHFSRATPEDRQKLRLIFFSTLLAMVPTIAFYFLPGLYGWGFHIPVWLVGLLILLVPASYVYAVTRQNLFGIDRLLNRTLVYLLLSSGIFILYLAPLLFFYSRLRQDWLLQSLVLAGLTLLVGWNFAWLRLQGERLVDRLFYGGWYSYPGVVDTISGALAGSLDRAQVTEILSRRVPGLMQLREGALSIGEPLEGQAIEGRLPFLDFTFSLPGGLKALWRVAGHLNGEDFSAEDRRILKTLAKEAGIALTNVVLFEALRRQIVDIQASQAALAELERELLRSREAERSRLARDLHDGPIQTLVGLSMQVGMLMAGDAGPEGGWSIPVPEASASPSHKALEEMQVEIRGLLAELRQVCAQLRPPMLDMLGLDAAIRSLAAEWQEQSGIPVRMDLQPDPGLRMLPDEVALNLYRVVQEALANVAHHAAAGSVSIRYRCQSGQLSLCIQDDGRGFEPGKTLPGAPARGHFGLAGIRERIELIGGRFDLHSAPGQGTRLSVNWQISHPPHHNHQ